MRNLLFALVAASTLLIARGAEARPNRFAGPHPVAAKFGGGYCFIEAPHLHGYAPDHAPLYTQVGDEYVFTGDPTPFGYDGDKHPYYGHHPIASANGEPIYCYINGPHYHAGPAPDDGYKIKKGVAFYVGPFAPTYAVQKPKRVKIVNAEYRPYVAMRPTIEVEPPSEWQGEVYVPEPSIEVNAPSVVVNAPSPPAQVIVDAPPPRVVVNAPPPPRVVVNAPAPPRVYVGAPQPHVVVGAPGVVVGAPGVVVGGPRVVVGGPRVVVGAPGPGVVVVKGGRGHHDHGKHKGWYK